MDPRAPTRAPAGTPLYAHLPFCAAKCHYCDFYSLAAEGRDVDGMLDALVVEIDARAPDRPRTVFLGGGTPSLLSIRQLERLLGRLEERTRFRSSAREVTIECNPESITREKARALLDLGVTRFTIGFQSLDDATLALFGRVHSSAQSFRAYEAVRAAGATNVGVDLIYAAPGQRLDDWERDLARVLAIEPDHVSAYHLAYEEGTPFRRWLEEGRIESHPEELELAFFESTRARIAAAGLEPYELSNFARPGRASLHNLAYWENGPYVGLGPSAVSLLGATRFGNARDLRAWARAVASGGGAAWSETLSPLERLGETWWLGLRTERGVDPRAARAAAGFELAPGAPDPAVAEAERWRARGLIERRGARYRLSAAGRPLADAVARELLAAR